MIKKNPSHLLNQRKKPDQSLRDYIKRFKAEKENIVGTTGHQTGRVQTATTPACYPDHPRRQQPPESTGKCRNGHFCPNAILSMSRVRRSAWISVWIPLESRTDIAYCTLSGFARFGPLDGPEFLIC
ncbi:unnamed protein product [Prunus brigantina]